MKQTYGKRNEKKTVSNRKSRSLGLFCCKNLSIELIRTNRSCPSHGLSQLKKVRLKAIYQLSII